MTDEELSRRFDQLHQTIRETEARTLETMRDMQTEILRGVERITAIETRPPR